MFWLGFGFGVFFAVAAHIFLMNSFVYPDINEQEHTICWLINKIKEHRQSNSQWKDSDLYHNVIDHPETFKPKRV